MSGVLHLVERGGAWAGWGPAQSPPRCTECNSPLTNGHPFTILLYDGPLFCGFIVAIKGLSPARKARASHTDAVRLSACLSVPSLIYRLFFSNAVQGSATGSFSCRLRYTCLHIACGHWYQSQMF